MASTEMAVLRAAAAMETVTIGVEKRSLIMTSLAAGMAAMNSSLDTCTGLNSIDCIVVWLARKCWIFALACHS